MKKYIVILLAIFLFGFSKTNADPASYCISYFPLNSSSIVRAKVILVNDSITKYEIDSVLLGNYSDKYFTIPTREVRYVLYIDDDQEPENIGEIHILYLGYKSWKPNVLTMIGNMIINDNSIYFWQNTRLCFDYEYKFYKTDAILPNRKWKYSQIPLNQFYEFLRIMILCYNLDGKHPKSKCDIEILKEMGKTNICIKGLANKPF